MSRAGFQPRREPKTSDLLIRQKVEAMIELDQVRTSVQSWVAHASGADAYGLRARLLSGFAFQRSVA